MLLLILLLPISVSAGLIGSLSNMFFKNSAEENLLGNKNVQNMALLVSLSTPPTDEKDAHVPEVENNALVPKVGPSGDASSSSAPKPSSDQINI